MCIICSYYTVAHEVIRLEFANYILRIATFISILCLRTTYHLAMPKTRLLSVIFNNSIQPFEINLFRGAIGNVMREGSVLFHNHLEGGLRYGYPLIQYKIINKKAAIVCLNEGADAIHELFTKGELRLKLGERDEELFEVDEMKISNPVVQVWKDTFSYSIINWLALNEANFEEYKALQGDILKMEFLEKILIGNILSFAGGINWTVEDEIKVRITHFNRLHTLTFREVQFQAFNLNFITNVSLPNGIGLGKGSSTGYGVIRKLKQEKRNVE